MIQARPIFDRLTALADPTRSRLLLLLDRHELTVGELCVALQLPQSTVSRHLKTLADEGWVSARAEGTSRRYTMSGTALDPSARELWQLVRDQVGATPSARQDLVRAERVLQERRTTSQAFFSSTRGPVGSRARRAVWRAHRSRAARRAARSDVGRRRPRLRIRADVGGARAVRRTRRWRSTSRARCSPRRASASVITRTSSCAADASRQLPIDDASLDVAVLSLVLHFVVDPAAVIARSRARRSAPAAACSSSTWSRTNARNTARRWAISGSASRSSS